MGRERPTRKPKAPPQDAPPQSDDREHSELLAVVHDLVERERLHVPPALDVDPVDLPFDLTTLSDKELQQAYSAFTAYSYRTGYLLMIEEVSASKCREAADEIVTAYIATQQKDDGTVTALKAQAEQHGEVKAWRKHQRRHAVLADALRRDRDNYDKVCERLSRLETMRHEEWERSGNRLSARKAKP